MTTTVRTPLAEWRQLEDGSWEPVPQKGARTVTTSSGGPGPGGSFGPEDILGGDNVLVTELPGGQVLIERGGHAILYEGVETAWRPNLDFQGQGVVVADDLAGDRTVVTIGAPSGAMVWRGEWDSGEVYQAGDVVSFEDAVFIYEGAPQGFGFGLGGFGEGPFGGEGSISGFGSEAFGSGPFGG